MRTILAKDVMRNPHHHWMDRTKVTQEAPGALPNGTRVEKADYRPTDAHPIGSKATIVGSLGPIPWEAESDVYGYFVEWDDIPGIPVFIAGNRLRKEK